MKAELSDHAFCEDKDKLLVDKVDLITTDIYLNLLPEDAIREFLNKW